MAHIFPDSSIILCSVPNALSADYNNVIAFKTETERYNYFSSKAIKILEKYSIVRKNESVIRVEGDYSEYMNVNYMVFTNSNFYNKHFYAFIDSVNYVAPNTTEIHFILDVMSTWFFTDCELMNCIVEREHVEDDRPYYVANTVPEGIDIGEYICYEAIDYKNFLGDKYVMLELSQKMPTEITDTPEWTEAVNNEYIKVLEPGVYNGLYKANYSYAFLYIDATLNTVIPSAMDYFARSGLLDMVEALYITYENFFNKSNEMVDIEVSLDKPLTINTYTPRNKKLLMYPYNYLELSASGQTQDIKYELVSTRDVKLKISGYMEPGSPIYMSVDKYQNFDLSYDIGVSTPGLPLLQYTKKEALNNYQLSQNSRANSMAYELMGGALNTIGGVLGAGNALNYSNFSNTSDVINLSKAANAFNYQITGVNQMSTLGGIGGVAKAAGQAGVGLIMNVERVYDTYKAAAQDTLRRPANTSYVNAIPNLLYTHNRPAPLVKRMTLWLPYLQKLDAFFDRFGYKVLTFKTPNINSRKSWNYLKLIECDLESSINQEYVEAIKKILQNGITFWHTTDVGNYSLDNSIV